MEHDNRAAGIACIGAAHNDRIARCRNEFVRRASNPVTVTSSHGGVARNVALLCHLDKWPREKTRARANELLEMVNLSPDRYANRYPHELSGGQRLAWRASSRPSQVSRSWRS